MAAKNLVIVESPAKMRTLQKYLGRDYMVKASVGHLVDLPKSRLGVDIEGGFRPDFRVIQGKKKIVDELKRAAKGKERVFLASDPDREGEAIAWHIANQLSSSGSQTQFRRLLINEITQKAIQEALSHPQELDQKKFNAQLARRVLDRLVGYQISPILWKKVRRGLSAGRVQSVAVRLVAEREQLIRDFVPQEYWSLTAVLQGSTGPSFQARLVEWQNEKIDNKKFRLENEAAVRLVQRALEDVSWSLSGVEKKERRRHPSPPFITSKLQQDASRKLGFQPRRTMQIAQKLYEGIDLGDQGAVGLITYMRTDSTRIAGDAAQEVRGYIEAQYGKDYLPPRAVAYRSKKGAQDAHEAIRPTSVSYAPDHVRAYLTRDEMALYSLIWDRFVASQMKPAVFDQTTFDIAVGEALFRATGQQLKFDGFMRIYTEGKDEEEESQESVLPDLPVGDPLRLLSLDSRQHFTQPPPRFTQATLIKELDERGIGRPSTYATIISNIIDREYVGMDERKTLFPTELGFLVTGLLVDAFPDILNAEFTAGMENILDKIEEGKEDWVKVMGRFYASFARELQRAETGMRNIKRQEVPTEIACDKCGAMMVVKWGRNGEFLACPEYPECKNTKNFTRDENGNLQVAGEDQVDESCSKCGRPMQVRWGKYGKFLGCSGYPECKTIVSMDKPVNLGIGCPLCKEGHLHEKKSRRGKVFYGCDRYPSCDFAAWDRPVKESCPRCDAPILLEKVTKKAGRMLRCHADGCDFTLKTADA